MKRYILLSGVLLLMNSCINNDFMDVNPKDKQTVSTTFTDDNFKAYSCGFI